MGREWPNHLPSIRTQEGTSEMTPLLVYLTVQFIGYTIAIFVVIQEMSKLKDL
jgi:hypothetical protein